MKLYKLELFYFIAFYSCYDILGVVMLNYFLCIIIFYSSCYKFYLQIDFYIQYIYINTLLYYYIMYIYTYLIKNYRNYSNLNILKKYQFVILKN